MRAMNRRLPSLFLLVCVTVSLGWMSTGSSSAFVLMKNESGTAVRWPSPCVSWWMNDQGTVHFSWETVQPVVREAFARWADVPGVNLSFQEGGATCFGDVGIAEWPGRQNLILWRDKPGDWIHGIDVVALTSVSYSEKTGQIVDADIEINTAHHSFSVGGSNTSYDLAYMLTHEIGHLLGIDHSLHSGALMSPNTSPMQVSEVRLRPDDENAVRVNYSEGVAEEHCETVALAVLSAPYCPSPPEGGCSAVSEHSGLSWAFMAILVLSSCLVRRRV